MLATYNGHFEASELLLKHGAAVDKTNDKTHTPLASVCFKGHLEIAKLLLKYGTDPFIKSGFGMSPFNCAIFFAKSDFIVLFKRYTITKNAKLNIFQKISSFSLINLRVFRLCFKFNLILFYLQYIFSKKVQSLLLTIKRLIPNLKILLPPFLFCKFFTKI